VSSLKRRFMTALIAIYTRQLSLIAIRPDAASSIVLFQTDFQNNSHETLINHQSDYRVITLPAVRLSTTYCDQRVGMAACEDREHISKTGYPHFTKFSMHVAFLWPWLVHSLAAL